MTRAVRRLVSAIAVCAAVSAVAGAAPGPARQAPGHAGSQAHPWLGVAIEDGRPGVRVTEVIDGTPADQVGLVKGDQIVALDGRPLASSGDLLSRLRGRKVGDKVSLVVTRGARRLRVVATLAPRLEPDEILVRRLLDKPAPRLAGVMVPGTGAADLMDKLDNKVVVIEFMESWCGPCRTTFSTLSALAKKHAGDGLVVLGTSEESQAVLEALSAQAHVHFPLVRDPGGAMRSAYRVLATPTVVVIDRDGVVRYAGVGAGVPIDNAVFAAERALGDSRR